MLSGFYLIIRSMTLGLLLENNLYKLVNLILLSEGDACNSSLILGTCMSFELVFFTASNRGPVSMTGDTAIPASRHAHTVAPRHLA